MESPIPHEPGVVPPRRAAGLTPLHAGLTAAEAAQRASVQGPNAITRTPGLPAWRLFAGQFTSPLVGLLGGACIVAAALGEAADALAILTIVALNGVIGFLQERGAARAIEALRSMTAPRARVRRDGRIAVIPASAVVAGDLLVVEAGDIVAADARLVEAQRLAINEAALTGESLPVDKSTGAAAPDAPLAERTDHVFMGTAVLRGAGVGEVVAIGMDTELGRIAHLLSSVNAEPTPLQRRLAGVGRHLLWICLAVVTVVALAGLLHRRPLLQVLLSAVALAVAAVPEGLPAVVTIALAVGVRRMASRHALIRRLAAVETLGCATVICTDKTGTLTTGEMRVRQIWGPDVDRLLFAGAACCDAELHDDGATGTGDPTEIALLAEAAAHGIHRRVIEARHPRRAVEPFDAATKRMAIARADGVVYVKGALETLLPSCVSGTDGALDAAGAMAARGRRVLAIAAGPAEDRLELLGLAGLADPPRPEAVAAVAAARQAGIRTVMITGDNERTALAIAAELGILQPGEDPADRVHARATPRDKLATVRAWKARGAIVAMTGDGVNDAPALREAHIGIAMGRGGTEVTREAADMILADDNFASVIAAVREGRGVYDNIRKTLVYLLAGNAAELAVMLVAAASGLPLPLLPIHLLWINIVTDGLPALALAMDPPAPDVLRRPPREPGAPMLGAPEWRMVLWTAAIESAVVLAVFAGMLVSGTESAARSAAFSTLVLSELFRAFAARSPTRILWHVGALTNLRLIGVMAVSVVAQVTVQQVTPLRTVFAIVPLSASQWLLMTLMALIPVTVLEVAKLVRSAGNPSRGPADGAQVP